MTYDIGQDVLLLEQMGEVYAQPLHAYVVSNQLDSLLYQYMIMIDGKRRGTLVLEDWLAPAEIVINEIFDTPWE